MNKIHNLLGGTMMKHCKNCGEALEAHEKFCKNCGTPVETQETKEEVPSSSDSTTSPTNQEQAESGLSGVNNQQNPNQPPRKPMSAKTKKLIGIIAAAVILLFITYKVIDSQGSYDKAVDGFDQAIKDKDVKQLKKFAFVEDDEIEITKDTTSALFDAYSKDKTERKHYRDELKKQGKRYESSKVDEDDVVRDNQVFNLVPEKRFGIFKGYKVQISPVYVEVQSSHEDTKVFVNDKEEATLKKAYDSKKVGPFLPGNVKVKGVIGSEVFELEEEEEVLANEPKYARNVSFYFDSREVTFYKPFDKGVDELKLLIDGKDVKTNIIKDEKFGPLSTDGSLEYQFEAEVPWGKEKSKPLPIESTWVDNGFRVSEELEKEIMERVIEAESERIEIQTSKGKKKPTVFTKEFGEEQAKNGEEMKENDFILDFSLTGIEYADSTFQLAYDDGHWYVTLEAVADLKTAAYEKGDKPEYQEDEEEKVYLLQYDEDKKEWLMANWEATYIFSSEKMIEHKLDDPIAFKTGDPVSDAEDKKEDESDKDKKDEKKDKEVDAKKEDSDKKDDKEKKSDDKKSDKEEKDKKKDDDKKDKKD